MKNPC
jgi:hypothetical protein